MKHSQIRLNAITTIVQVVCSAAILFFLYRFLIRSIGIERLGIWSLVLATTSVVTLANQGFSTSIVRFVAQYAAREDTEKLSILLQTAILSMGFALMVVSLGLYPMARWVLQSVLPESRIAEAYAILPLALVSLWLDIIEGILQAGLVGHERIHECNYLELGGSFSYLLMAELLVPRHGLLGLAYAQVLQAAALVLITWCLLRKQVPILPVFPFRWNWPIFREIAVYGCHFQLITASQALREPVTKTLMAKFGGLASTGLYDIAARCVITLRELIVQANQVLIPTISYLRERAPHSIPTVYRESYRLVFFLAVPAFSALIVISPIISRVWIGSYEPHFVAFTAVLSAGWLVNVLSNPAYIVALGTGYLRWVTAGCFATAILNACTGFLAGRYLGGTAVVAASAFSQAAGYAIVLIAYFVENRISFSQLLPKESAPLLAISFAAPLICFTSIFISPTHSIFSPSFAVSTTTALFLLIASSMWIHPMRKRLVRWIFSRSPSDAGYA